MSLLLAERIGGKYRTQPKGTATINWDHPLTRGLTFDMTASLGFVNNVTNVTATTTVGASTSPTAQGLGYQVSQSAGNCIYFSDQVILNTFPFSILIIANTVVEANRKFVFQFGQNTSSAAARVWVLFNGTATGGSSSDSSGKLYLYTIDTSLGQNSPAAGGMAGGIIDGVHSYGITRDSSTVSYYRDGKLLGTESPTNGNNIWTSLGITSINGVSPALSNTRPNDRSQVLTRFWNNRLLTETDYLALYENPWQIYKPRTRDKWIVPTIGAGGDVTVSASAQALSLSLQSPVITTTSSVTVTPTAQALVLSEPVPTVSATQNVTIQPTAQGLSLSAQAPVESGTSVVQPTAQALTLNLIAPGVTTDGSIVVPVSANTLNVSIHAPAESGGCVVALSAQNLSLAQQAISVSINANVTPSVLALISTVYGPVIHGDGAVTPSLLSFTLGLQSPTVSLPGVIVNTPSRSGVIGIFIGAVTQKKVFLGKVSTLGVE